MLQFGTVLLVWFKFPYSFRILVLSSPLMFLVFKNHSWFKQLTFKQTKKLNVNIFKIYKTCGNTYHTKPREPWKLCQ